jgi:HEPN domain-containing protein
MNRNDFRELARTRRKEARLLLRHGCYEGAYYLAGYVIECALKACIAKGTKRHDFPDKKKVTESYTHDLVRLVGTAGLESDLDQQAASDPLFEVNWAVVDDWTEESRYQKPTEREARDLYSAVTNPQHGVLRWLGQHW